MPLICAPKFCIIHNSGLLPLHKYMLSSYICVYAVLAEDHQQPSVAGPSLFFCWTQVYELYGTKTVRVWPSYSLWAQSITPHGHQELSRLYRPFTEHRSRPFLLHIQEVRDWRLSPEDRRQVVVTSFFRGFAKFLRADSGVILPARPRLLPFTSFPIRFSPVTQIGAGVKKE